MGSTCCIVVGCSSTCACQGTSGCCSGCTINSALKPCTLGCLRRLKSSRIRLGLLQCLQAMAKSDSRALHQHWTALLPTALQLQHRAATPNLGTMLLFDPVAKVRGARGVAAQVWEAGGRLSRCVNRGVEAEVQGHSYGCQRVWLSHYHSV